MTSKIRKITVEFENGDLATYRGAGSLADISTVSIDSSTAPVTKLPLRYITATLRVDAVFTQPMPAGLTKVPS